MFAYLFAHAHVCVCTNLTGISSVSGHGADHPPPPKRRGHEKVELYLYSPSGPSWPVTGRTLPLPFISSVLSERSIYWWKKEALYTAR